MHQNALSPTYLLKVILRIPIEILDSLSFHFDALQPFSLQLHRDHGRILDLMFHHVDDCCCAHNRVRAVREEHVREAVSADGEVGRGVRRPPVFQIDAVAAEYREWEAEAWA